MGGDHRSGPRRRGDALVGAILTATVEELEVGGYAALTMDAVARRAGTGKASLYRRWASRAELVQEAVYRLAPSPGELPDTGTLRGDLLAMLRGTAAVLAGPAGEALRGLLAEALPDAGRVRGLRAGSRGRNAQLMAEVLARAVARGEIPEDAVVPQRLDVGGALVRNLFLFREGGIRDDDLFGIVDAVLLPLFSTVPVGPEPGQRLPGPTGSPIG